MVVDSAKAALGPWPTNSGADVCPMGIEYEYRGAAGSIPAMMTTGSTRQKNFQFTIRTIILGMAGLAVCLAIALTQYRRLANQQFVQTTIRPITDKYVSSVGYANGRIVWLRANAIDPHHPNGFDEWVVPLAMDMFSNDGSFGPYQNFDDHALGEFAREHPTVRAIDIRDSAVTVDGLRHLAKLEHLEWLWLDSSQSSASGLSHLHGLDSLRTIALDLRAADPDAVARLRNALEDCRIVDHAETASL